MGEGGFAAGSGSCFGEGELEGGALLGAQRPAEGGGDERFDQLGLVPF
ncbi:MAG: hypothetical protein ACRD0C_04190 [Acidimicrobiia bacterium]